MPGIKRRVDATIGSQAVKKRGDGHKRISKGSISRHHISSSPNDVEGEESNFDNDVDLLAEVDDDSQHESSRFEAEETVDMYSDEDLEGGFEDVNENESTQKPSDGSDLQPPQKQSLYAIPSRDEISTLKNTSELFKSNVFKLKIEEMLKEVRPRYEKSQALDYVLRKVKSTLEAVPEIPSQTLVPATESLRGFYTNINIPFPHPMPKEDSLLKYSVEKPSKIQVGGSWILRTASLRPGGVDVDMFVVMRSTMFQEKDHLNMRYIHKRAFYLAALAGAIEQANIGVNCFYSVIEDPRKPILVLKPNKNSSESDFSNIKAVIKVHLAHEENLFPLSKLSPSRNNIRSDLMDKNQTLAATPRYNASILEDALFAPHLLFLNNVQAKCPEFASALLLLKTWASQRTFGSGPSRSETKGKTDSRERRRIAFGSGRARFFLTMLLAHLLNGPDTSSSEKTAVRTTTKLSPGFSSFQLFRGTLEFLASNDFRASPVFMRATSGITSHSRKIPRQEFIEEYEYVFVDPTGSVNLLGSLLPGTLQFLQREAASTTFLLNDAYQDHFDEIFMLDQSKPALIFDDFFFFQFDGNLKSVDAAARTDYGSSFAASISKLSQVISRGLTDRCKYITMFTSSDLIWSIGQPTPEPTKIVEVGLRIDPAQAFRLVDHGPRPEDVEAAASFKAFWGSMSELRRFRDGRIVESVVWNAKGLQERLGIPRRIVQYLLEKHLSIRLPDKNFQSDSFCGLLEPQMQLAENVYLANPDEIGFQSALTQFNELANKLREVEGLPLSLISITPTDAGLRGTSTIIPSPLNLSACNTFAASYLPNLNFVLTFESSGQWPDDLEAIQAMKLAFYEILASKIMESIPSSKANVVLDADKDDIGSWNASASSLEILLPTGFSYRGRIHHDREQVLLQRLIDDKEQGKLNRDQAKAALFRFQTLFVHSARHHNHINALTHRFPSFAHAIRLSKRWISSQLLGLHVPEELIELIASKVYIQRSTNDSIPSTGHAGFLQIVKFLSQWNWREEPLSIEIADATSAVPEGRNTMHNIRDVEKNFANTRRLDPELHHYAWFIATEDEIKGVSWARDEPSAGSADALQRLAKGAIQFVQGGPLSAKSVKVCELFIIEGLSQYFSLGLVRSLTFSF